MRQQTYFARGKLLLFGEYFVLFGSKALAVPTKYGQHLKVQSKRSYDPKLIWQSYDSQDQKWFDAEMDLWHFDSDNEDGETSQNLKNLLSQVRRENPHFLREKEQVRVQTKLEFPLEWGLGSSSSLIFNIAQWARVNPFDLGARALGGSGCDIACAQANGPIVYRQDLKPYERAPECLESSFSPEFKDQLYFVYLGNKEKTNSHLKRIQEMNLQVDALTLTRVDEIIDSVSSCSSLESFEELIREYESLVESYFDIIRIKARRFEDYWGEIKSLGAWGGDFVLATSTESEEKTREYFLDRGCSTVLRFDEIIFKPEAQLTTTQTWEPPRAFTP